MALYSNENENEKEETKCPECNGKGELSSCCDSQLKTNNFISICSTCKSEKPKTFICNHCEGEGIDPNADAEQDAQDDAEESFRDAFNDN